jgi:hypothetical protein
MVVGWLDFWGFLGGVGEVEGRPKIGISGMLSNFYLPSPISPSGFLPIYLSRLTSCSPAHPHFEEVNSSPRHT